MNGRGRDTFWVGGIVAGALVLGGVIAVYVAMRGDPDGAVEPPPDEPAVSAPEAPGAPTRAARPPAPAPAVRTEPPLPLPPLDESDAEVRSSLNEMFGERAVMELLVPERIVRNVVVTIDNLPRERTALEQRPFKPAGGKLLTGGTDANPVIAAENYARYEPFVKAVQAADARMLVSMYRGLQPLFQEAYEELGHPNETFNARLLEVIEHLLATPEVEEPIALVQPSLLYEFADEELEALSAGQKLLIRIGPANRAVIKAKLREIRAELV